MIRFDDLRCREVINLRDGMRYGYVCDLEINEKDGCILAIVVPGGYRFFGLFGRRDDYVIEWTEVRLVGEDLILVDIDSQCRRRPVRRRFIDLLPAQENDHRRR